MNLGGAKDRADLAEVWEDAKQRLTDEKAAAKPQVDYRKTGILSMFK
jgi:hypothetical protein